MSSATVGCSLRQLRGITSSLCNVDRRRRACVVILDCDVIGTDVSGVSTISGRTSATLGDRRAAVQRSTVDYRCSSLHV